MIIELSEGTSSTKKLWRFYAENIQEYTLEELRVGILSLFPHLQKKNFSVNLWHEDDLVGKVNLYPLGL